MNNVLHPTRNYIRDYMHTLVSGGVAGTHLALMCQALAEVGCPTERIRGYCSRYAMPYSRNRGKVSNLYFKDALMATDHVRHFAGGVLGMIPLLHAFLVEKILPRGVLVRNVECFSCLHSILCFVRRGDMNEHVHAKFLSIIVKHNTMFLELYGERNAKIKFHHLYHLPDDMLRLGKFVGCFTTERKNKDAKAVVVATDKNIERSSIISFLHRTICHWADNDEACKPEHLRSPSTIQLPNDMSTSRSACLLCGDLHAGDMVLLLNQSIGEIVDFWQLEDSLCVRLHEHKKLQGMHFELQTNLVIDDVSCIVEAITYLRNVDDLVAVLPLFDS